MQELKLEDFKQLVILGYEEDLDRAGDITGEAIFGAETCHARLISKDKGIVAGLAVFEYAFKYLDNDVDCTFFSTDGSRIDRGDVVAEVHGKALSILKAERTALNFLSYLTGIATKTAFYVEQAGEAGKTVILDTRKTLPGYRKLAKYAVRVGGGKNHRLGLYDMVLIKDNHIDVAGSITEAVRRVKKKWQNQFTIEVECRTLAEVEEALANEVDIIMLDNMNVQQMRACLELPGRKAGVKFEASGGMEPEMIKQVSVLGVDYVSVGSLTHSVKAFDFSLKINLQK